MAPSHSGPLPGAELRHRDRQQQQRGGEDRRNDARGVELQRQVRGIALEHAVAHLPLGILDQQAALGALDEDDGRDHGQHQREQRDMRPAGDGPLPRQLEQAGERAGQAGDDARHDDQRGAVADAARRDLLAEPHQEHGAADQRHDSRDAEEPARIDHHGARCAARAFQPEGDAVGLERRQRHRHVAGVLVDLLAALLAFLLQGLERRHDARHQLHDDRGRDVGHDVEREDRHALDGAAGEHVEHAEDAGGLGLEGLGEGRRIDAGDRDVGAEPVDDQRASVNQIRFLSSSALAKAPKFRLAASCSAAETIAALPGPPASARLVARWLPPTWDRRPWCNAAIGFQPARPTARRGPLTRRGVARACALFLARRGLRLAGLGLLGGGFLALGLVGREHLLLDQRDRRRRPSRPPPCAAPWRG